MGCADVFAIVSDDVDSGALVDGILGMIGCNVGCFEDEVGKSAIEVGGNADSGKLVGEIRDMMGCKLGWWNSNWLDLDVGDVVCFCVCNASCMIGGWMAHYHANEMVHLIYSLKMMAVICSKARD